MAAYCSLPRFRGEARFRTWLYTLAIRITCRKRPSPWWGYTEPLDDFVEVLPDQTEDPAREVERADWNRQVRRALQGLPEKYRQPLVLCYVEELSYEEIAAILQIPLPAVRDEAAFLAALGRLLGGEGEEVGLLPAAGWATASLTLVIGERPAALP